MVGRQLVTWFDLVHSAAVASSKEGRVRGEDSEDADRLRSKVRYLLE